jgi:hypothetical protein
MMAPEYYVFTGRVGERAPDHVTHVLIDKALKFIRARAFNSHPNIEEVICHDGVLKIEEFAFYACPRLRRVIMPGVKEVEKGAFKSCGALTYVECGKLEIMGTSAFSWCVSLSSVDLPSIKIVEINAFCHCQSLINARFGNDLESIRGAFKYCDSLERIALPLKNGMVIDDNTFQMCGKLNHVDLIVGVHETIDSLLIEEWKNDMNEEVDAISQILPNTPSGNNMMYDTGGKAREIRAWISSVLRKIVRYKAEHRRYLNEATAILQSSLPNDIVLKNVLPFLELPSYTFDGED